MLLCNFFEDVQLWFQLVYSTHFISSMLMESLAVLLAVWKPLVAPWYHQRGSQNVRWHFCWRPGQICIYNHPYISKVNWNIQMATCILLRRFLHAVSPLLLWHDAQQGVPQDTFMKGINFSVAVKLGSWYARRRLRTEAFWMCLCPRDPHQRQMDLSSELSLTILPRQSAPLRSWSFHLSLHLH